MCGRGEAIVLDAHQVGLGATDRVVHTIGAEAHCELSFLHAGRHAAAAAARGTYPHHRAVKAVGDGRTARCLAVGGDVEHAAHAFRVVFHARIGNNFDVLDRTGRHHFKDGGGVLRQHLVGLAVHIHLETAAPVDGDIVLAVHRHHRHLAEHIEHGRGLGVHVAGHIVGHLVDLHLHQRPLGRHDTGRECLHIVLDENLAQVERILLSGNDKLPACRKASDAAEQQLIVAGTIQALREAAFLVGCRKSDGLFQVTALEELQHGGRLTLTGQGIPDDAGYDGFLCKGRQAQQQGRQEDHYAGFHYFVCFLPQKYPGQAPILRYFDQSAVFFDEFSESRRTTSQPTRIFPSLGIF